MKYAIFLLLTTGAFAQTPTTLKPWEEALVQFADQPPQINPVLNLQQLPDVGPSPQAVLSGLPRLDQQPASSPKIRRNSIRRNFLSGMGEAMVAQANSQKADYQPAVQQEEPKTSFTCTTIRTGNFSQSFCQ